MKSQEEADKNQTEQNNIMKNGFDKMTDLLTKILEI